MKDVKVNISAAGFPSQFASDSEKASDEYGLMVGQAIQYEWFKETGTNAGSTVNGESSTACVFTLVVSRVLPSIRTSSLLTATFRI